MNLRNKIIEFLEKNDKKHPPSEEQLKNRKTLGGRLCVYHPISSTIITILGLGAFSISFAYGVKTFFEYIK